VAPGTRCARELCESGSAPAARPAPPAWARRLCQAAGASQRAAAGRRRPRAQGSTGVTRARAHSTYKIKAADTKTLGCTCSAEYGSHPPSQNEMDIYIYMYKHARTKRRAMSYNDTSPHTTEAEQGPTHMLIHEQDAHIHHRNYSHTARVQQAGWSWSATRPARKCRKRCTAAHGCAKREQSEASSASVQPRPCRLRSPVSTAGRGQQGHPCGEGWHAPLETAGIYLLR